MELLISCGDEVEMGRRSPMVDGIYKITFLQRGILITQFFFKKEKSKKRSNWGLSYEGNSFFLMGDMRSRQCSTTQSRLLSSECPR